MSMLNFYINRARKNLPKKQKRILENAKQELRDVFWPHVGGTRCPSARRSNAKAAQRVGHSAASPLDNCAFGESTVIVFRRSRSTN
jgi:hypothetical protein